jgi:hypothetical protein
VGHPGRAWLANSIRFVRCGICGATRSSSLDLQSQLDAPAAHRACRLESDGIFDVPDYWTRLLIWAEPVLRYAYARYLRNSLPYKAHPRRLILDRVTFMNLAIPFPRPRRRLKPSRATAFDPPKLNGRTSGVDHLYGMGGADAPSSRSTPPVPLQTSQCRRPVPPHSSQSPIGTFTVTFLPVPWHSRQYVVPWPRHLRHNNLGIAVYSWH